MIESRQVVHCHARSQGLPSWRIDRHHMNIIVDTSEYHLVLFKTWLEPEQCHHFSLPRFSLDGQVHSQGSLQEPITGNFTASVSSLIAPDVDGCTTIWSYTIFYCDARPMELMRVQYDPQHTKGSSRRIRSSFGSPGTTRRSSSVGKTLHTFGTKPHP